MCAYKFRLFFKYLNGRWLCFSLLLFFLVPFFTNLHLLGRWVVDLVDVALPNSLKWTVELFSDRFAAGDETKEKQTNNESRNQFYFDVSAQNSLRDAQVSRGKRKQKNARFHFVSVLCSALVLDFILMSVRRSCNTTSNTFTEYWRIDVADKRCKENRTWSKSERNVGCKLMSRRIVVVFSFVDWTNELFGITLHKFAPLLTESNWFFSSLLLFFLSFLILSLFTSLWSAVPLLFFFARLSFDVVNFFLFFLYSLCPFLFRSRLSDFSFSLSVTFFSSAHAVIIHGLSHWFFTVSKRKALIYSDSAIFLSLPTIFTWSVSMRSPSSVSFHLFFSCSSVVG